MTPLPLSTLLSYLLVAFTIELDNEAEHRLPHRTTHHGATPGTLPKPWLVSLAMWYNCLRFVGEQGVTVGEVERLARTPTNLDGMRRWGYIVVAPDPADPRPRPPQADWMMHAAPAGRVAQAIWRALPGEIERRWQTRFGEDAVAQLRQALWAVVSRLDVELPDCLPILGHGLWSNRLVVAERQAPADGAAADDAQMALPVLLARVLLVFALEFERQSKVSLALSANVLRLVEDGGVRVRDLPRLAGVSQAAVSVGLSFLTKHGYAVVEPEDASSRVKAVWLSAQGQSARAAYFQQVEAIERRWQARFGAETLRQLRVALEGVTGRAPAADSPLRRGMEPYPDGWRAAVPRPEALPHFPLVLHRGGYPDGS